MSDVYKNNSTTTKVNFRVEDITHKPKRLQSDNLRNAIGSGDVLNAPPEQTIKLSGIPKVMTIERVIKYFEDNANGEFTELYKSSATWLREYLTVRSNYSPQEIRTDLKRIVTQLEWCDYACEAGALKMNADFIKLKELAGMDTTPEEPKTEYVEDK